MSKAGQGDGQTPIAAAGMLRRRVASPTSALILGGAVLGLLIAGVPLAGFAHQSVSAGRGSVPLWISAGFAAVGFVLAWRRPRNPLGWIILCLGGFFALSEDASFYVVADYRIRHGGLPFGWLALLAQPGWAPGIVLLGLAVLLFPDGQPPSPRWRWLLWAYAFVALLWIAGAVTLTLSAIAGHTSLWTPAAISCPLPIPAALPPGGGTFRWRSSCSWAPPGWRRWPARRSATGAPPVSAASS